MRSSVLGQSGVSLPAIGLGTWSTFDTNLDLSPLVQEALASGVTLFDSSPMYGRAEATLKQALGNRRAEAIVATKVSAVDATTGEAQIANALKLFGTVDLFQIHNIVSWRIHLPVLAELRQQGLIRAIGASQGLLVSDDDFEEIIRTGLLDSIQVRYNPNRREAAERILPLAADLGIGVCVMQPLRWGVLLPHAEPHELAELEVGDWGAAILRWILSNASVTSVLMGTASPGRIRNNATVGSLPPFNSDQMRLVETILARGAANTVMRSPVPDLQASISDYLSARLGACFCDLCLAREFGATAEETSKVRQTLPSDSFADEEGPCLSCGETKMIARSRTIMR